MLRRLRIQNFKAWKDTGTLRIAPITLLFGANSSGKSSIGQFLMMLKQTVELSDRKAVLYPGSETTNVNLGSYKEMVYGRNATNNIEFSYEWDVPQKMEFKDPISGNAYSVCIMSFSCKVGMQDSESYSPYVIDFKYHLHNPDQDRVMVRMYRCEGTKPAYRIQSDGYKFKRRQGRAWSPRTPNRFYGFPDEVVAYHKNADFVQQINLEHENLFNSMSYLGPLRTKGERLYAWSGNEPASVGYAGENCIAALLAARKRKINPGFHLKARPFEEIIAQSLQKMGLIENFKVNIISKQRQVYEVKVCVKGSENWVDLPDVGFGVSQVLPVLVQCFYAPEGSIIFMEQPEIHLHPRAQSELADVMINVINSREKGKDRNIQLIIETHSEHFLRRLQRRIAEDTVSPDKVAAYFANTTTETATLEPLKLDTYGNIQNWPDKFFGDEMEDITAQATAAMQKRMKQKQTGDSV